MNISAISKKIFKYIENIEVGEISDFIIEDNKATIIKLVDKKISETKNLNIEKIKADLIERKKNEMFGLYSSSFLSKLKNSTLLNTNEKKIIILSSDPNSINSEIIFKTWKNINKSLRKRIYLISNHN